MAQEVARSPAPPRRRLGRNEAERREPARADGQTEAGGGVRAELRGSPEARDGVEGEGMRSGRVPKPKLTPLWFEVNDLPGGPSDEKYWSSGCHSPLRQ